MLQAGVEIGGGVGQAEGFQTDGLAAGVLAHHHEVAGVGDQHLAVTLPVAADLLAVGGEPGVVGYGLDLNHAALGELAPALLLTAAALGLAGGVESEVGMSGALVGQFGDAEDPGAQRVAHGVEQVGQRAVSGTFAGSAARRPNPAQVGEVGGDGLGEFSIRHSYPIISPVQSKATTCGRNSSTIGSNAGRSGTRGSSDHSHSS